MKTVVFDKTGTLTNGKPSVVSAVLFSSYSMEEFCDMAAAAEVGGTLCYNLYTGIFDMKKVQMFLERWMGKLK